MKGENGNDRVRKLWMASKMLRYYKILLRIWHHLATV